MQGGIGDIVLWAAIIPAQREETDGALICGPTPIYNLSQLQCFSTVFQGTLLTISYPSYRTIPL